MIAKFMRIIAILTITIVNLSCNDNKTRSITYDSNKISIDSSVKEDESFESYEYLKQNYVKGYKTTIEIDTTFYCKKRQSEIHLILKHKCLLDNAVKIPSIYNWGEKKADWVTHNFISEITLFEKEKIVFEKTISKGDFINLLDEPLKNYAVLMYPRLKSLNPLQINYSISIPITDIGIGARLTINTDKEAFQTEVGEN